MLLCVDIGNTNTCFAIFHNNKIVAKWELSSVTERTTYEYHVVNKIFLDKHDIKNVIISSVVPRINNVFNRYCLEYLNIKPILVEKISGLYDRVLLKNKEEVGADRIVNAFSVFNIYNQESIIIDFGTATTIDVIDKKGNYCGGIIYPGLNTSLASLFSSTAKLPNIDIERPSNIIGKNTKEAIQSGVYWGYISLIDGLIDKIIDNESNNNYKIIATGGLANLLSSDSRYINNIDNALTMKGLNYIYNNYIEKESIT